MSHISKYLEKAEEKPISFISNPTSFAQRRPLSSYKMACFLCQPVPPDSQPNIA
jgi:hypothetical protein